jgi:hypothetical protein
MSAGLEEEVTVEREASWAGMAAVGFIVMSFGLFMAPVNPSLGGGIMIIGICMMIAASAAKKWERSPEVFADLDYKWEKEMEARLYENEIRSRYEERQLKIDDIVKAVKSTIRVRCRYCGTLNTEKANKCESCGGSL